MDFARAVALAQRLINKNGRSVTIQRLDATAADSNKPWRGAGEPTVAQEVPQKAVFLPSSGTDLGGLVTDDELLKRAEQVCLVAGDTDLTGFNIISDDSIKWKIEWIQVLKPADVIVLYAIGVKR